MSLDHVTPGAKVPETFNVIIEISMNGDPIKYEVDKDSGCIFVDRFMNTAMHYPTNYGYVPKTIAGDGDPVDVLVITPVPLYSQWQKLEDLNPVRLKAIEHFFEHYKDLDPGKWVKVLGWGDKAEAHKEITDGIAAYAKG